MKKRVDYHIWAIKVGIAAAVIALLAAAAGCGTIEGMARDTEGAATWAHQHILTDREIEEGK